MDIFSILLIIIEKFKISFQSFLVCGAERKCLQKVWQIQPVSNILFWWVCIVQRYIVFCHGLQKCHITKLSKLDPNWVISSRPAAIFLVILLWYAPATMILVFLLVTTPDQKYREGSLLQIITSTSSDLLIRRTCS